MAFDAEARISRSRAAIDKAQEKANSAKNPGHGRYFIAKPRAIGGGELPNRAEWLEEQARKSGKNKPQPRRNGDEPHILKGRK